MDKKPVCLKQWEDGMELNVSDLTKFSVWVQLQGLPLKYWGKGCLEKIVGLIGKPILSDNATQTRERVSYVRYLIEVDIKQQFPDHIEFYDERGDLFHQDIIWEWKPIFCNDCGGVGYRTDLCPNKRVKKVWRKKEIQNAGKVAEVIGVDLSDNPVPKETAMDLVLERVLWIILIMCILQLRMGEEEALLLEPLLGVME
uniref:DUF4283 domain-containing protein n=1 Tax=Chenopodium quinoa TaxID=63459 RepID=A0A803MYH5_CHEQI